MRVGNAAGPLSINVLSTLNIGEGAAAGILQAGSLANNGVLNFDHTDAALISAPISGSGQITKVDGAGDTTLANVSAFTGSFSVQGGLMNLQGNANGSNYTAAGNGTLRFSGGTVNLGIGFMSPPPAARSNTIAPMFAAAFYEVQVRIRSFPAPASPHSMP